jgi:hypothetical protein
MYFVSSAGKVCHILRDGRAENAMCGLAIPKLDLFLRAQNRATLRITAERPAELPLCKHCEKQMTCSTVQDHLPPYNHTHRARFNQAN